MDLDDVIPSPQYRICHSRVYRGPAPGCVGRSAPGDQCPALPLGHALEGGPARPAFRQEARALGWRSSSRRELPFLLSCFPSGPMSLSQQASARPGACWEDQCRRIWTRRPCAPGPSLDGLRPEWNFASNRFGRNSAEHRDAGSRDGPENQAGLRRVLVCHPAGQ